MNNGNNVDVHFALYVALTELAKIGAELGEIKDRDYDGELEEFTSVIDDRIDFVFSVAKDDAYDVFYEYKDTVSQAMAEANHP